VKTSAQRLLVLREPGSRKIRRRGGDGLVLASGEELGEGGERL